MSSEEKQQSPHNPQECHNANCPNCIVYNFVAPATPVRVGVIRQHKNKKEK